MTSSFDFSLSDHNVADIFADQFLVLVGPFSVTLSFGATPPLTSLEAVSDLTGRTVPFQLRGVVRTSPSYAKAMAIMLRHQLKVLETTYGEITVPSEIFEGTDVSLGEW